MLRKLLITFGVLVGLLVAVVIAASFVDVNHFKPRIAEFVSSRYQRTLSFGGDVKLSLFPDVGVTLPAMKLSEPNQPEENAATLGGARVSVALLPLIKGQVQADTVSIEGLDARVVRNSDGSLSIDDLIGAKAPAQDAPVDDKPAEAGKIPAFRINGVVLKDARVVFDDRQAGQTYTLERMSLETGPLANVIETPVALQLGFSASAPESRGEFGLKGRLALNLDEGLYGFHDFSANLKGAIDTLQIQQLAVNLKGFSFNPQGPIIDVTDLKVDSHGRMGADAFKASVAAPRLAIARDSASGETVEAKVSLGDKEWLNSRLSLSGVGGTASDLKVDSLGLESTLKQDGRGVVARLSTPVQANLDAGRYQLARIAGQIDIDDPALPKAASSLTLDGKVSADLKKETVAADMQALLDKAKMVLKAGVNGFKTPRIHVELDADELNVDRLFPPAKESEASAANPPAAPGNAAETPVDLSALKNLTLDARVGIGHLVARGLEARQLKANAKIANGQLTLAPFSAALYDGRLAGSSTVTTGSSPAAQKMTLKADFSGISIEPLLKAVADMDMLEGRGNLNIAVNTGGGTVEALKRSLGGNVALALKDGALKGINLGEKLRAARDVFKTSSGTEKQAADKTQKTDFTEMSVSFAMQNGIARSNDLSLKSPLLRVGGEGSVDIGRSVLDYTVKASVVGTSSGQGGRDLTELRGVTIPVRLTGAFDALAWQIDWAAVGKEALKSKAGAELQSQAKEKLKAGEDQLKEQLKGKLDGKVDTNKARDALKGLFGK
ncbi:MAG: AsmA family protein [Lautropia sp.]|nr:AsmA family protein [Lautropia sp.]